MSHFHGDENESPNKLNPGQSGSGGDSGPGGGKKLTGGTGDENDWLKKIIVAIGDETEWFKKLYCSIREALEQADRAKNKYESALAFLSNQKGVQACLLCSHDGTILAAKVSNDLDADTIAQYTLGVFMSTEMVLKKMPCNQGNRVHALVSRTDMGYALTVDISCAILFLLATEDFTGFDL